eukprot:6202203-Pleurochrysis_carterae.AAC.1
MASEGTVLIGRCRQGDGGSGLLTVSPPHYPRIMHDDLCDGNIKTPEMGASGPLRPTSSKEELLPYHTTLWDIDSLSALAIYGCASEEASYRSSSILTCAP